MTKYTSRMVLVLAMALTVSLPDKSAADRQPASLSETITFFYYRNIADAVPFYEEVLRLEKTMDEDWVKIYRISPTSSVGLVLQGHGYHDVAAEKPAMLSIVTDDVDAWYARVSAANVPILSELPEADSRPPAGRAPVRGFIAADPGGYTIEFFTWQRSP